MRGVYTRGFDHTDSDSAQHFWLGKTHNELSQTHKLTANSQLTHFVQQLVYTGNGEGQPAL